MKIFQSLLEECCNIAGASVVVCTYFSGLGLLITAFVLPILFPCMLSFAYVLFVVFLTFAPLEWPIYFLDKSWLSWYIKGGEKYFPIHVKMTNEAAIDQDQNYLIGMEPHSTFPLMLPTFCDESSILPKKLHGMTPICASSFFRMPLLRHFSWWGGVRSNSPSSLLGVLKSGKSATIVPGAGRETLYARPGAEVLYLKKRRGFIRLAIQTGTPLIPVFAFGQSQLYTNMTFGIPKTILDAIRQLTGMQLRWTAGRFGSPIPKKVPILIVYGTPIKVPKQADPDTETVQKYLDQFIEQMRVIFKQNKDEAGMSDIELEIL